MRLYLGSCWNIIFYRSYCCIRIPIGRLLDSVVELGTVAFLLLIFYYFIVRSVSCEYFGNAIKWKINKMIRSKVFPFWQLCVVLKCESRSQ